uniref:Retrotransposon gag domain-containing protein n=1 Tax=Salix viminalis TaxID=40686 RepID=A0A6N2MV63_SALVM
MYVKVEKLGSTFKVFDESPERFIRLICMIGTIKIIRLLHGFRNTSIPAIHIQFADFDSTKEIWDFLANRYQTTGLAHYYQLWTILHSLKQGFGQFVNDFLDQIQPIWNQLSQANISEDHLYLIQVLMALRPEYESIRASLLH